MNVTPSAHNPSRQVIGLCISVLFGVTTAAGCSPAVTASPTLPGTAVTSSANSNYQPLVDSPATNIGYCPDASDSWPDEAVASGFDAVVQGLQGAVEDAATLPTTGPDGAPGQAGLNLVVRQVSAASLGSTHDEVLRTSVPAVPALIAPPDPAEYETYSDRLPRWQAGESQRNDLVAQAAAARSQMFEQLRTVSVSSNGSEILGCITALRDSFPAGEPVLVVVTSDLAQAGTPQMYGDYRNLDVLVGQYCADAAACAQAADAMRSVLQSAGVRSVGVVSVNQLTSAIQPFVRSTP